MDPQEFQSQLHLRDRGRKNIPIAYSNFTDLQQDLPMYESFIPGEESAEAPQPRGHAPHDELAVLNVDLCMERNKRLHRTTDYENTSLIVRRGQAFYIRITFNRPVNTNADEFQLEFLIGSNPSPSQGSLVSVPFPSRPGSIWKGEVDQHGGATLTVSITPKADAIVGLFRTYVAVVGSTRTVRTKRDPNTDFYMLFNAWCTDDDVYMPNEAERHEYVLNDYGVIYQGQADSVAHRPWVYGQFEKGVLESCIYLLDKAYMPIYNRGNVVKLARKASAMINAQDDSGMLVGRWDGNYNQGTPPTLWTGSVKMLLKYTHTGGTSICYAQCWVYAGVFNTFMRCMGIPCRVITNFGSAHDNSGNLTTDLYFLPDGRPDRRRTTDSIWNYHCWNEMFMVRRDLPDGLNGWQAVDATPQETSDGHYRCGPTAVSAIKTGQLSFPFDAGFVFAEVNSDLVFYKTNRFNTLVPYRVDKTHVGQLIVTKSVGSNYPYNVTGFYKYPEGSREDEETMRLAERYGCNRDHSEVAEVDVTADIVVSGVRLGDDFDLIVEFYNAGEEEPKEVQVRLTGSVVFYTGANMYEFLDKTIVDTVDPLETKQRTVTVSAEKYMPFLRAERCLLFTLCGTTLDDDQDITAMKMITLLGPELSVEVSDGVHKVGVQMYVTVEFINPFHFALENVEMELDGPGLLPMKSKLLSKIDPNEKVTWQEYFTPMKAGERHIVAGFDCTLLHDVSGETEFIVEPKEDDES